MSSKTTTRPQRHRWEKDTRYYEAHVEPDLWGGRVLTRIWGRRGTSMGQMRRAPCASYAEALGKLAAITKQRTKRGYLPTAMMAPGRQRSTVTKLDSKFG